MKTSYVDAEHRAIADLVHPGELTSCWTITRINVPAASRGQGVASGLLKQILADADTEGAALMLEVSPSDGLDYEQLTAWYGRYGFRATRQGWYMKRRAA